MKELQIEFTGTGESRTFHFKQLLRSESAYLYECITPFKKVFYEVFKRRENARYNVVSYPKSKSFGKWAWTYPDLADAMQKFESIGGLPIV